MSKKSYDVLFSFICLMAYQLLIVYLMLKFDSFENVQL